MKRRILSLLLILCTICLLAGGIFAHASAQLSYITDTAGLLDKAQTDRLEAMAQSAAKKYSVGLYIVTVEDYRDVDQSGINEAAYGIYHAYELGEGAERNGLLLLLSMNDRDYAIFRYGEKAEYAFSDYGIGRLDEAFLDNFGNDDWIGGFEDYIRECGRYLEKAESGKPVDKSPLTLILIFCAVALVIAAVVCAVLVGQMKTVHKSTAAAAYAGNLELTERMDQFTHRTETRRKVESKQSSGSGSPSGSSSGKF